MRGRVAVLDEFDREIVLALAAANMNVAAVERRLPMHINGIYHRIRKIRKLTGLDPQNFYALHKLVQLLQEGVVANGEK